MVSDRPKAKAGGGWLIAFVCPIAFDRVTAPKELWVFDGPHHMATLFGARNIG